MSTKKRQLQIRKLKVLDYVLIIGVSILVFTMTGLFFVYMVGAKTSQIELVKDVMVRTAESQEEVFNGYIQDRMQTLKALVTYPEIYEMNEQKQREFIKGKSNLWGFSHLFIMDMDGNGYYVEEDLKKYQGNEPFFQSVKENESLITEPFYNEDGSIILTLCLSIKNAQGSKVGVLCGAVRLENIQKLIEIEGDDLDSNTFVLEKTGKYVTSRNASDIYNRVSILLVPNSEIKVLQDAFLYKTDQEGIITLDGVDYLTRATYLEDYQWVIVQTIPVRNIVSKYHQLMNLQYILSVSIACLLFCIVRIILNWRKSDKKMYTDPLTGGNNRAACFELLETLQSRCKNRITIVYMDLNRFKWVNDTYGHEKGDELLKLFAEVLESFVGHEAFVGRLGGDEFIAVFLDTPDDKIHAVWLGIGEQLRLRSKTLEFDYTIEMAYGVASRECGEKTLLSEVLNRADEQMYTYKIAQKEKQGEKE